MRKFKRVWHPYQKWEEVRYNMWGTVDDKKSWVKKAVDFTSDDHEYGKFMVRVTREWPFSCENALTDYYMNRKAWIGHAACALALMCPEHITRQAWKELTHEQQYLANKKAIGAIQAWENVYIQSSELRKGLGGALL